MLGWICGGMVGWGVFVASCLSVGWSRCDLGLGLGCAVWCSGGWRRAAFGRLRELVWVHVRELDLSGVCEGSGGECCSVVSMPTCLCFGMSSLCEGLLCDALCVCLCVRRCCVVVVWV